MLHPDRTYHSPALLPSMFVLFAAIVAATLSTVWLVVEVRKERDLVQAILAGQTSAAASDALALSSEVGWQAVLSWLVLGVLMVAAFALLLMVRAYSNSQRSLRDLQALSLDVLASLDKAVVTVDENSIITSANPASLELIGIGSGNIGRPVSELRSQPNLAKLIRKVNRSGQALSNYEYSAVRKGRSICFNADCQLLTDSAGKTQGTVILIDDVTERTLLEERMRRMERYMGLGSLAAGLHHEIKNPLGALSLHLQLLEEKLGIETPGDARKHLQILKTEIRRIGDVLESFRDFTSSTKLNVQSTDVSELVQRAIRLIQPQLIECGITLAKELPEKKTIIAEVDATRLEQLMLNLSLNAIEAMESGGQLSIRLTRDERYVKFEVADTGSGIPESIRSRVFDPYFTTKQQGSGMGLAVCQKIVQQHGGTIECDSRTGGTIFRATIPLVTEPAITADATHAN